jgi:acetolactate synthase-1/2/3 large subunit
MITHLIDSIHTATKINLVSLHHEQAAAFAADATGRMTGLPGVAMATSGPGAVNLLTGVGSCYFDSSPAVFLTGQVNRHELRGERPIRQLGFQETDIVSMAKPITKGAWLASDAQQIPELLDRAFALATAGRPGPVLIDLPMDVQRENIPESYNSIRSESRNPVIDSGNLFLDMSLARRPLILAGSGVWASKSATDFLRFVDRTGIPVVYSLLGVDVLPYAHPLRVGMIGSYGNRWANLALAEADFLLVIGSRLDIRQTGANTPSFKGDKIIYHVDVEPNEINNRVAGCHSVVANLQDFLPFAADAAKGDPDQYSSWRVRIDELRHEWPDTNELAGVAGINPNVFMHALSQICRDAAAYVVDVGQHQMWAAQSLELAAGQRFLTSGGMGSMGFSLPASIGAAFASGRPITLVAGDGGFQCNIQELQTVARNKLPIRMVVLNNMCHGMVRQFQESYFDGRYQSTMWGYSAPDFARVAAAYDIPAKTIATPREMDAGIHWLSTQQGAALLHVKIDPAANAYPKMAFGRPFPAMEPFDKPMEMEGT